MKKAIACFLLSALGSFLGPGLGSATTVTTVGAGSAVGSADRTATFNGISGSLSSYQENGLFVTAPGPHCCFTDVHYEAGGNTSFVTIATVDGSDFVGLEFDFGTGNPDGLHNVVWEIYRDDNLVDSGLREDVFASRGFLDGFTVLGWVNNAGFDEMRVGSWRTGTSGRTYTQFGQRQAIALDNVKIDYGTMTPVPLPATFPMLLIALVGAGGLVMRRRRLSSP